MKLSVSLDTQNVTPSPNPLRIKAGSKVPCEVTFTRNSRPVPLESPLIEFAVKPSGAFDADLLVFHNAFSSAANNAYVGTVNCDTSNLVEALGLGDGRVVTDKPQIEASGEIAWTSNGEIFRSATFPIVVEAPINHRSVTFYGKFTATAYASDGNRTTRCVVRSSQVSQSDADAKAKARCIELVNSIVSGEPEPSRYLYQVRNFEERLLRILYEAGYIPGSVRPPVEIARVTENRYGAEVINTRAVMFVDVDTAPEIPTKPQSGEDKSTAPLISEAQANSLLDAFCLENPAFGFRVYKTFAGLRYLCTSGLFDPTSEAVKDIFNRLNADQSYRALCKIQKCFRARLTPKPWRVPGFNGDRSCFRKMDFTSLDDGQFRLGYLQAIQANATCHYIRSVGSPVIHPSCSQIAAFHDTRTQSSTALPLA